MGASALRFEQITTFERLRSLRQPWTALWFRAPGVTPFSAPEWLLPWCRHLAQGAPWSIAAWRGSNLAALAPTFVYLDRGERVLGLLGGGVSDYQDVLAEDAGVASQVVDYLSRAGAFFDRCQLEALPPDSLLLAATSAVHVDVSRQDVCPAIALPRDFDGLVGIASPKLLADLRRQRRHAARAGGYEVIRAPPADPGALLDELFRLHGARWHSRGEQGVLAAPALHRFHQEAARLLAASNLLRLVAVRLDGRTIGTLYGLAARGRHYAYLQGIDPTATRRSPGTVVLAAAIEQAIAEGAVALDLLRGAEEYKYRWGAVDRPTFRFVFHPRRSAPAPAPADEPATIGT